MLQMREQAALEQGIDTTQLNPERRFLGEVSSSWHKTWPRRTWVFPPPERWPPTPIDVGREAAADSACAHSSAQ